MAVNHQLYFLWNEIDCDCSCQGNHRNAIFNRNEINASQAVAQMKDNLHLMYTHWRNHRSWFQRATCLPVGLYHAWNEKYLRRCSLDWSSPSSIHLHGSLTFQEHAPKYAISSAGGPQHLSLTSPWNLCAVRSLSAYMRVLFFIPFGSPRDLWVTFKAFHHI
jgi:hypothetical protein